MQSLIKADSWAPRIALTTAFFTGLSGLVYEVTWQRFLGNLLGSQSKSTTIVLAVFLGGLALGYRLFGNLAREKSSRELLGLCGKAELGIGIWALLFPLIYGVLWDWIGVVSPLNPLVFAVDFLLAVILIGVPSTLMGCTLPLLTQGLSLSREEAPSIHARIYAWNTGGAFLGCLLGGFFLIPYFGLPLTDMYISLINIGCGFVLLLVGRFASAERPETPAASSEEISDASSPLDGSIGAGIAFLAGFLGLTFQTILIRVACISLGSSEYTFSMIVSIYILMLALGAATLQTSAGGKARISLGALVFNQAQIIGGLIVFYFIVPSLPYWFMILRTVFSTTAPAFYAYYLGALIILGGLLAIPLLGVGRGMPLLFGALGPKLSQSGRYVGRIYFWNAFGCVLGALIGGYFLLCFINMDSVLRVAIFSGAVSLALMALLARNRSASNRGAAATVLVAAVLVCAIIPAWNPDFVGLGLFQVKHAVAEMYDGHSEVLQKRFGGHVIARRDDPNTSVSVLETKAPFSRSLLVNGKSDGSTYGPDLVTTRLLAHLPVLLGGFTEAKAAVVGFGTGITPATLSLYNNVQEISCIEISPAVRELSDNFSFSNHDVTRSAKFHWRNADAYRYLASTKERLDLIVSEPSNPWVGGVERLYSQEFYTRAAQSLTDRGIFSQWFHSYSISKSTLDMVLKTFSSVFPYYRVFAPPGATDLIIIGSKSPIVLPTATEFASRIKSSPEAYKDLTETGVNSEEAILSLELPIEAASFSDGAIHTLDFPKLSFAAGKDYFQIEGSELSQRLDLVEREPLSGSARGRSLFSQWNEQGNTFDAGQLKLLAKIHCHQTTMFPGWRNSSEKCQEILLGLAARQLIPSPEIAPEELVRLRQLSDLEPLVGDANLKDSIQAGDSAVRAFAAYDSSYLPLKVDRLLALAAPCTLASTMAAYQCQAHLIEALAWRGYPAAARAELDQLLKAAKDFPKAQAERLSWVVKNAE